MERYRCFRKKKIGLISETSPASGVPLTPQTQGAGIPRNNPLNIEYSEKNNWKGQTGKSGRFATFLSPRWGYRAAVVCLYTYFKSRTRTVEDIVNRWAPPSENDTEQYIQNVVAWSGCPRTVILDWDFDIYSCIVRAMARMENGLQPTNAELLEAWKMADMTIGQLDALLVAEKQQK